jgi:hypothetical protein
MNLSLYKIDSELEGLLDYRQSRVEDPVEPAGCEEPPGTNPLNRSGGKARQKKKMRGNERK